MSIVPINSNTNGSLTTSFTASVNFEEKTPIPIFNENEIILEMNNIGPMGPTGPIGPSGPIGPKGEQGNGIVRIEKTFTSGAVDTYTIFFTNGTEFNYTVTNGVIRFYNGPYEVTPSIQSQILSTENLGMLEDVFIKEIPYYEVSNLSGGYTATIGDNN